MADANRLAAALQYQQDMEGPVTMNPNIAEQGRKGRANMAPPTSVMDPRSRDYERRSRETENFLIGADILAGALPFAPLAKGAAMAAGRYAGPELARGLENYMAKSGAVLPMDVWHGSPHRFPPTAKNPLGEFDPMKIGTGEGAQAYGAGAGYLAEAKGVAANYRNVLSDTLEVKGQAQPLEKRAAQMALTFGDNTTEGALKWLSKFEGKGANHTSPQMTSKLVQQVKQKFSDGTFSHGGSLYKVDLPDEQIAKMLDWDKPLSEQSWYRPVADVVREYKGAGKDVDAYARFISKANARGGEVTGGQLYEGMLSSFGGSQAKVSEFMRDAGIPGIRYLDQGSRSTSAGELIGVAKGADGWQAKIRKTPSGQVGDVIPMAPSITTSKSYPTEQAARDWANSQIGGGTSNFVVFDPAHMNIIGRE